MSKHPSQGEFKKVLCVCSGGILRSPTVAWVLSNDPFNFNTRAVGAIQKYAMIQLDEFQIEWADEIVCMEEKHVAAVKRLGAKDKKIICLNLSDDFTYRDPELIKIISKRYNHACSLQLPR